MAQVIKLENESWAVYWVPQTPKSSTSYDCNTNFKIPGRKPSFALRFLHSHPNLTVTLVADKATKYEDDELPKKVRTIIDGKTSETVTANERANWSTDVNPWTKFNLFQANQPRYAYEASYACQHDPEVHVMVILDFLVVGETHVVQRMVKLLETGDMADVQFYVEGKQISAHKNILVAASPVMAAMLDHENFKEGRTNTVNIEDVNIAVFQQLLRYMYTGTAPLLDNESMREPLFLAADKYQVAGLKRACVDSLIAKLTVENVVHFLVIGYLHSAPNLEEASLQLLEKHPNDIWKRSEWRELMTSYPNLFFEACSRMIRSGQSIK